MNGPARLSDMDLHFTRDSYSYREQLWVLGDECTSARWHDRQPVAVGRTCPRVGCLFEIRTKARVRAERAYKAIRSLMWGGGISTAAPKSRSVRLCWTVPGYHSARRTREDSTSSCGKVGRGAWGAEPDVSHFDKSPFQLREHTEPQSSERSTQLTAWRFPKVKLHRLGPGPSEFRYPGGRYVVRQFDGVPGADFVLMSRRKSPQGPVPASSCIPRPRLAANKPKPIRSLSSNPGSGARS